MESLQPDDSAALAHHWAQAGEQARACGYFLKAGDLARALIALPDAAAHYQSALARWPEADSAGRAELLFKLGQCQWMIMETLPAVASLEAARDLFEGLNERKRVGDSERLIGRARWELGDMPAAWPHYRRALAILEQEGETVEWARAVSAISQMYMLACDFDQSLAWGERALALGRQLAAEDVIVHALNNIGASLTHIAERDPERGLALLRESQSRANAFGLPHDVCRAYINLGDALTGLTRYADAHTNYEEQLAYATRVQARAFMSAAIVRLSVVDWTTGRWQAARARHPQIVEIAKGPWQIWASTYFGRVDNDLGRPDAACQTLEATQGLAARWTEMQTAVPHLGQLARAYMALGRQADAAGAMERGLALTERSAYLHPDCLPALLIACEWYLQPGHSLDGARACLAQLERADGQMHTPETAAVLAEAQGRFRLAGEMPAGAVQPLQQAAAGWAAIDRPYDQARSLERLGLALAGSGDAGAARTAFGKALDIVETLAAQLDERELRAAFRQSTLVREIGRGAGRSWDAGRTRRW